ncbi:MAG: aminotransferase class IV [Magnetococcus sp. DMHC-6]
MRLDGKGRPVKLKKHLRRLKASAVTLGFVLPPVRKKMVELIRAEGIIYPVGGVARVVLEPSGGVTISGRPMAKPKKVLKVRLVEERLDRLDRLLQHKTTRRDLFNNALEAAKKDGFDEVLFLNNLDRVTEGAIRAILVRLADGWYAPPLADGLLPSLWRQRSMKRLQAKEKSLTVEELTHALEIRMGNSVQGTAQVGELVDGTGKIFN